MYRKIHYNKKLSRQNNSSFDFNDSVFFLEGGENGKWLIILKILQENNSIPLGY